MKNRVIAGAVALTSVLALVALALMAGRSGPRQAPVRLPVLGGAARAKAAAAPSDLRVRGPLRYELARPLPVLESDADAYVMRAPVADLDRIASLAHDLGVDGEVTATDTGWTVVHGTDHVDVQRVAGLPWSRYGEGSVTSSSGSSGTATVVCGSPCPPDAECIVPDCAPTEPTPMPEPQRPKDLPAKADAERIGRALLTGLGVDLDHAAVTVEDGFSVWTVSADPVIAGAPVTGMTTSVGIGPNGAVSSGSGWLEAPVKGDRYPLIGTTAAFTKLGDEQVRTYGAPQPAIAEMPPDCGGPAADCVTTPPEPIVVRITGVTLGLQLFRADGPDQPAYLVPTYLFRSEDGNDLPVIAVEDRFLAPVPTPKPAPVPMPEPEQPLGTAVAP